MLRQTVAVAGSEDNPITPMNGYMMDPGLIASGNRFCKQAIQNGSADVWIDDKNVVHLVRTRRTLVAPKSVQRRPSLRTCLATPRCVPRLSLG